MAQPAPPPPDYKPIPINHLIRQSPPLDLTSSFSEDTLAGKVILITGGASGFGAGYSARWAAAGATIIVADISEKAGEELVADIRSKHGEKAAYFVRCNVTDWQSQVACFKEAVRLSPHGGIDVVVANAGIAGDDDYELPRNLDADAPPKPNLKILDVNLIGVVYTVHLALFWLKQNPGSKPCSPKRDPSDSPRDRHILLMGSMASLGPIPGQVMYAVSKHGVLGMFRTLRSTSWVHGIRVNMLCPYFIDTPILPAGARVILAGAALGKPEDVVEAATRVAADSRICGRSLYIGPKVEVVETEKGEMQLAKKGGVQKAIWECYAEDYDDSEIFGRRVTKLLNAIVRARGFFGFFYDLLKAIKYGFKHPSTILGKAR